MADLLLRAMQREEWPIVAALVHEGTNAWYREHFRRDVFTGSMQDTEIYCRVYETLDPGCCLVAEDPKTGTLLGSCFYHPRTTHVSLGIMNVHPEAFGRGVARQLLQWIVEFAERQGKPVRLVSSAMSLDSFSLYNRAGFVPFAVYQDMQIAVPDAGLDIDVPELQRVRSAVPADVPRMAALEEKLVGIEREKDYRYFLDNQDGIWNTSVLDGDDGRLQGFLVSVAHAASRMLGPGVAATDSAAAALLAAELDQHRGHRPVWLLPADRAELLRTVYGWGARNCELHLGQCRGPHKKPEGVVFPTFLPETA